MKWKPVLCYSRNRFYNTVLSMSTLYGYFSDCTWPVCCNFRMLPCALCSQVFGRQKYADFWIRSIYFSNCWSNSCFPIGRPCGIKPSPCLRVSLHSCTNWWRLRIPYAFILPENNWIVPDEERSICQIYWTAPAAIYRHTLHFDYEREIDQKYSLIISLHQMKTLNQLYSLKLYSN